MGDGERKSTVLGFRLLEMVFGAFLGVCVLFGVKDFESNIMPVVENFVVNEVHEVKGGIEMTGTMTKVRECQFREMMVYTRVDDDRLPVAADFEFLDPAQNLKSRATMSQRWGPWRIFIPVEFGKADIDMFVRHSCHSFYDTTTKLHSFNIEKSKDSITVNQ